MPQLYLVGLIGLLFGIVVLMFSARQRCPRCDASLPRSARQCPHCGQVLGLAVSPSQTEGPPRYCPECKGEFRHGIVICPECQAPLVERPAAVSNQDQAAGQPEPPPDQAYAQEELPNRGELKSLCPATTPEEADFLIEALAENDIPAVLMESQPRDPQSPLIAVGAGDIVVGEMDLPRAKQILAELEKNSELLSEEAECGEADEGMVCDECGAEVGPEDEKCPRCGAEFEEEE